MKLVNTVLLLFLTSVFSDGDLTMDEIQLATINYGHLKSQQNVIRRKEETKLLNAMTTIGFVIITNHGIRRTILDTAWNATRDFFDSDINNKMSILMTDDYIYGYSNEETLSRSETDDGYGMEADQKETFQVWIGAPNTGRDANVLWPQLPTNFKAALTNYYRQLEILAAGLLESIAITLKLTQDFFKNKINDHMSALRLVNYPALNESLVTATALRCSPHSDYGTLTLLKQNDIGGLQVNKNQKWYNVISDYNDFIMNLGDLMQRWTNDKFRSTRHRVVNKSARRQSIAFFHNLNANAIVETIPSCLTDGTTAYPPIKFSDYLYSKHRPTMLEKSEL